jgi:hypothetical protein
MPDIRLGDEELLGATPSETACLGRYHEVAEALSISWWLLV